MVPGARRGESVPHRDECENWWPEGGECTCPDSVWWGEAARATGFESGAAFVAGPKAG